MSLGQLCLEDIPVNEKLQDKKFIRKQLNCIMAHNDDRCDQFGKQLKRKNITSNKNILSAHVFTKPELSSFDIGFFHEIFWLDKKFTRKTAF